MQPICKRAKEKNWPRWFCRRSRKATQHYLQILPWVWYAIPTQNSVCTL